MTTSVFFAFYRDTMREEAENHFQHLNNNWIELAGQVTNIL
jgi:hypothetical protein